MTVTIENVSEGEHTLEFKNVQGYENLSCRVWLERGVVSCVSVSGGACERMTPPGVEKIADTWMRAYLKPGVTPPSEKTPLCAYVNNRGGKSAVDDTIFLAVLYSRIGGAATVLVPKGYELAFTPSDDDFLATMYLVIARTTPAAAVLVPLKIKQDCGW